MANHFLAIVSSDSSLWSKKFHRRHLKGLDLRSSLHKTKMKDHNNAKHGWFTKCMKAPIRLLTKAKHFYIHSITECSGRFPYLDAAMGCPTGQLSALPRSFSVSSTRSSSVQDYKDLVKAAAAARTSPVSRVEFGVPAKQPAPPARVPRSRSVVIGRIDEDKPCDFGDDLPIRPNIYPRSKSYAARRRSGTL
ncbi:uncharacterized protein LOC129295683 [Prosopis cineraria]|uniref:uncharacterized protein LOC129295683 n=1 Tax=Prosopis cineraria TaxID=364024 RepID=UPI00240FE49F|nr:uncharacterized protein LOC129295683 [Prosopis cineraria]